jgi:N-acetylmuramoyl-L-alanine amidase
MFAVQNHRLLRNGAAVAYKPTPNLGGALKPEILVMHFTGSSSAASAISWLANPAAKASAHLVIAEDGTVTQLAPFNKVTWHAGKSSYHGRENCNRFSIGIELANAGQLARAGNGGFVERLGSKAVPPAEVIIARHKNGGGEQPWEKYDPRQMEAAIAAAQAIVAAYKLRDIVGHDDIAPGRKSDPGPAFPMDGFKGRILGRK